MNPSTQHLPSCWQCLKMLMACHRRPRPLQAHQGRGPTDDLALLEIPEDYAPLFWWAPPRPHAHACCTSAHWLFLFFFAVPRSC